jgi:UDP-2,3-diacylglucosamine pyrophosphatase LpxH
MLMFLSDLHLADAAPPVVPIEELLDVMRKVIEQASTHGHSVRIVLLGDVFEMLKSDAWLHTTVRPWDSTCTSQHEDTVNGIFERILQTNQAFFDGLATLVDRHASTRVT